MSVVGRSTEVRTRFLLIALLLVLLPLLASAGFMWIEGWGFLDSLYMSVITLSTVGYHEQHPLSEAGRVFVIFYIVIGLGFFVYGTAELGEAILRGQLRRALGRRRVDTILKTLAGHYIVCGFGRTGSNLCRRLASEGKSFVVVDRDADRLEGAESDGWLTVVGDATDDSVLEQAGLARAAGLATVLSSDADNLYVVISARLASPELMILARATDQRTDAKMRRAGANRIVNLHEAGAHKMAQMLTNPHLQEFMEVVAASEHGLELARFEVPNTAPFSGKRLDETDLQQRGIIIIALQKKSGELHLPPKATHTIDPDDVVTVLGAPETIEAVLAQTS